MSLTKTVGFVAVTTLAVGGAAFGAEQTNDLASQIADLKAEIASLKGAQGGQWLTEQRAAEIRGIVTDVLADAETRSSLQGAAGSGYNGGFFLSSADGNFSMKINLLEQIRWSFNDNDTDWQAHGFENKRTRMTFSGNMVDSTWSYKLAYYLGASELNDGFSAGELSDAYVSHDYGNGMTMTVGQFKTPFSYEYSIDAGNLQFTDYSLGNTYFGTGYSQGLMFGYAADQFRASAAWVNQIGAANQDFNVNSPGSGTDRVDWALAGRAEFKFAGDWAQFNDGQSWKGEAFGAMAGIGYTSEQTGTAGGAWGTSSNFTVDVTFDFGGANVGGAYYMSDDDAAAGNSSPYAMQIFAGVFLTDKFELVARYEVIDEDAGANTTLSTFSVGGNWYIAKNTAKAQFDFGYAGDAINTTDFEYANWTPTTSDGEWVVRAQLSFSF
jgi:Phosphate-selective porin O and P